MSKITRISRQEDMSSFGMLRLFLQPDGDIVVHVDGRGALGSKESAAVEFCDPGAGGGRSPRTLAALRQLAEAMRLDNELDPN